VTVLARHAGREHRFAYESYEGRTTIAADVARDAGIDTAVARSGAISDELALYGAIAPDATRVRAVHARFLGVIRSVSRNVGDSVRSGDALATIESNESLQTYTVTAPISGTVTARHAAPGEQTDSDALFEIADFSSVWAELDVFSRDRARVKTGLLVLVAADDDTAATGSIDYVAPVGDRASQRVTARVSLDNADARWTPGRFVEGA
jgi:cobalt-zinc-cadmium efflux system membrane fusion protein